MIAVSCAVIIGMLLGYFTKSYFSFDIGLLIQFGLYFLLFFIGIDIGKNENIINDLKKIICYTDKQVKIFIRLCSDTFLIKIFKQDNFITTTKQFFLINI